MSNENNELEDWFGPDEENSGGESEGNGFDYRKWAQEYLLPEWGEGSFKEMMDGLVAWLHPKYKPVRVNRFIFPTEVKYKDKNTQEDKSFVAQFEKYLSPDDEKVHLGHKRQKDGKWRHRDKAYLYMPVYDVGHKVMDYVWEQIASGDLSPSANVFEWQWKNSKGEAKHLAWQAGYLCGYVDRGQQFFNVTLKSKSESILQFVNNASPSKIMVGYFPGMLTGKPEQYEPKIDKSKGLLMMAIEAECREAESEGDPYDMGKPTKFPYPFKIEYDEAADVTAKYKVTAYRQKVLRDKIQFTDTIRNLFAKDPHDISHLTRTTEYQAERLYTAMKSAAQIDLPLNEMFDPWFNMLKGKEDKAAVSVPVSGRSESDHDLGSPQSCLPTFGEERLVEPSELEGCPTPRCGLLTHPEWNKCPKCEHDLVTSGTSVEPPSMEWLKSVSWPQLCNVCSAEVTVTTKECPECHSNPNEDELSV
jgi:hypothetical protein